MGTSSVVIGTEGLIFKGLTSKKYQVFNGKEYLLLLDIKITLNKRWAMNLVRFVDEQLI
jgi:hypothetical protein